MDFIDLLMNLGVLAAFIVFAIVVWSMKKANREEPTTTKDQQPGGEKETPR